MSVYRRGPFFYFKFWHGGKKVDLSTRQSNRQAAIKMESAERTRLSLISAGLVSDQPKAKVSGTVNDLLDRLVERYKEEGKATPKNLSTIKAARAAFGNKTKLSENDIESYISRRLKAGRRPATINRPLEALKRAYKIAEVASPKIRHLSEKGNERKGFFSVQELESVVLNLPDDLQDFTRFCFVTAWRKGEAASLRWSDIEDGIVRLRPENSKNGEARQIVIDGDLVQIIERRRAMRAVNTAAGTVLCEYVFHRGDGAPIKEFRKSWARACAEAGVPGKLFHDLRRSGVRDMIRGGVSQTVAMKISGHKTASMFRRYNITSEDDLRAAMLSLQRYREAQGQKVVQMASK